MTIILLLCCVCIFIWIYSSNTNGGTGELSSNSLIDDKKEFLINVNDYLYQESGLTHQIKNNLKGESIISFSENLIKLKLFMINIQFARLKQTLETTETFDLFFHTYKDRLNEQDIQDFNQFFNLISKNDGLNYTAATITLSEKLFGVNDNEYSSVDIYTIIPKLIQEIKIEVEKLFTK